MTELLSLRGHTALVTGAAGGIGRATSLRLAEAGARLVLVDIDEAGMCVTAEAVAALEPPPPPAELRRADVGAPDAVRVLWAGLDPAPDVLVNNAGCYPFAPFLAIDEAAYRHVMAVNLESVFWMCQELIRRAGRAGGRIVNIGSVEAVLPFKRDLAHYGAAKAAVIALTRSLAREHGRRGIRVNVVVPGGIVTPGTRAAARDVVKMKLGRVASGVDFLRRLPLGRLGDADEVARVIAFLASDAAAYMQGAVVAVDGGFLSS